MPVPLRGDFDGHLGNVGLACRQKADAQGRSDSGSALGSGPSTSSLNHQVLELVRESPASHGSRVPKRAQRRLGLRREIASPSLLCRY